jgi:hypothetical protein
MESLGVVGSRSITNKNAVRQAIVESPWWNSRGMHPPETWDFKFVSGGADGVDTLAEQIARDMGVEIEVIDPNWDDWSNGHPAKYRNTKIVEMSDYVVAVWDGHSNGTRDTIDKCLDKSTPLYVSVYDS